MFIISFIFIAVKVDREKQLIFLEEELEVFLLLFFPL